MLVREYRPGDEELIAILFEKAFKRPLDIGLWHWRYMENPFGKGVIRLAFEGKEAVGHYAVVPVPLEHERRVMKAALSMTTMTSPEHEGRGIFTALAKEVYAACVDMGIVAVFGFPNANSYHGFTRKLGWIGSGRLYYFELPNVPEQEVHGEGGVSLEVARGFDEEVDYLWENRRNKQFISVSRNSNYLNWRICGKPSSDYLVFLARDEYENLIGYIVINEYEREILKIGQIIDVFADESQIVAEMLSKAVNYFTGRSVDLVITWAGLNWWMEGILQKMGFIKKRWVGFSGTESPVYFGVKELGVEDVSAGSLGILENWYLTMGDSDVF